MKKSDCSLHAQPTVCLLCHSKYVCISCTYEPNSARPLIVDMEKTKEKHGDQDQDLGLGFIGGWAQPTVMFCDFNLRKQGKGYLLLPNVVRHQRGTDVFGCKTNTIAHLLRGL